MVTFFQKNKKKNTATLDKTLLLSCIQWIPSNCTRRSTNENCRLPHTFLPWVTQWSFDALTFVYSNIVWLKRSKKTDTCNSPRQLVFIISFNRNHMRQLDNLYCNSLERSTTHSTYSCKIHTFAWVSNKKNRLIAITL